MVTTITRLVLSAVFGRRSALNHLHRLHGIDRDLVREDLALLICDGLAIDGERIRGVIAQPVKRPLESAETPGEASVTSELSDEDCALERQLVEEVAIDVGVRGGIGFEQIRRFAVTVTLCWPRRASDAIFTSIGTGERTFTSCSPA